MKQEFFHHLSNLPKLPDFYTEDALSVEYEHIEYPLSYSANSEPFRKTKFYDVLFNKFGYADARYLKVPGKTVYSWHIDKGRKCAINWPIVNNTKAITIFRQIPTQDHIFGCEEVDYTNFRPTLLNTTYSHCVINPWPTERIILTVSVNKESSYEEVKSFLETLTIDEY